MDDDTRTRAGDQPRTDAQPQQQQRRMGPSPKTVVTACLTVMVVCLAVYAAGWFLPRSQQARWQSQQEQQREQAKQIGQKEQAGQQGERRDDDAEAGTGGDDLGVTSERGERLLEELQDVLGRMGTDTPAGANARSVESSASVPTAAEAYDEARRRGFGGLTVYSDYKLSGDYTGLVALGSSSVERHPTYMIRYESKDRVLWDIHVNDGRYFATPTAYGDGRSFKRQILLSEMDTVTQYDPVTGKYSDFEFDRIADTDCIRVERIDKATLDSYTVEQLEGSE